MKPQVIKDKNLHTEKLLSTPLPIILGVELFLLCLMLTLRNSTAACDWFVDNITLRLNSFSGSLASKFPFSAFEFFVFASVFVLLIWLTVSINFCVSRLFKKAINSFFVLAIVLLFAGNYYMMSAGLAYNRSEAPKFTQSQMSYYEFYDVVEYYKQDFDRLAAKFDRDQNNCVISPYSFDELSRLLINECSKIDYLRGDPFTCKKLAILSDFYTSLGITGITFTPTGDCGLNIKQPPTELCATMAHEIMHSLGIMRERDANVFACYLLISSSDDYLRYAGLYEYYGYLLQALTINYDEDEFAAVYYPSEIIEEYAYSSRFWSERYSILDKIGDFFNSLYLKMSGVKEGTGNYYSSTTGGDSYVQNERTFKDVNYNDFQLAFIKNYQLKRDPQ